MVRVRVSIYRFAGGPFDGAAVDVPRTLPLPTIMGFTDPTLAGVHIYSTNGPTEPGDMSTEIELYYDGFNSWEELQDTCIWRKQEDG